MLNEQINPYMSLTTDLVSFKCISVNQNMKFHGSFI